MVNLAAKNLYLLFAAAMFALGTLLPVPKLTPDGTQCPLAPVQTITAASPTCCPVAKIQTRAPKPGDKGFVQCRCAEKKAAHAKASTEQKPVPIPNADFAMRPVTQLPEIRVANRIRSRIEPVTFPPLVRPPVAA